MSKRTVIVVCIGIALLVFLAIGGGLWWCYQNSGHRLLVKADVALRANRAEKALGLAGRYIAERPKDWQGHYVQARAYLQSSRYEEARKSLESAARCDRDKTAVPLLLAETFLVPARRNLASKELPVLREAVNGAIRALDVLSAIEATDPKDALDILERTGLLQKELADAQRLLEKRLEDEADRELADAQRLENRPGHEADSRPASEKKQASESLREESRKAAAKAEAAYGEAVRSLLEVVRKDPSRDKAATALVRLCLDRKDKKSLAAARKAIIGVKDATPVAATLLVMNDLRSVVSRDGPGPVNRKKLAEACGILDKISESEKHKDNIEVKLARIELATRLSDLPKANRLCEEVLAADDSNPQARLHLAEILMQQGQLAEAERKLASLRKDLQGSPLVHFAYGRVSLALGKTDQAREALRDMAKTDANSPAVKVMEAGLALALNDPTMGLILCDQALQAEPGMLQAHLTRGRALTMLGEFPKADAVLSAIRKEYPKWPQAHLAYAQLADRAGRPKDALLAAREALKLDPKNSQTLRLAAELGLRSATNPDQALKDAQAFHQASPNSPAALRILVQAAVLAQKTDLARKALEKTAADHATAPEMLMAVADGYRVLDDRSQMLAAAQKAAECSAATVDSKTAVARALILLNKVSEAEKLLDDALKKDPTQARLHYQFGQLCARTGRLLPAIDLFRAAVKLDKSNDNYGVTLARALLDAGDVAECRKALDAMDTASPEANLVRLQLKLIQGQPVNMDQMLQQAQRGERSALAIALSCLATGQLQKCVDVCEAGLASSPDNTDLRLLLGRAYMAMGQEDKGIQQLEKALQDAPERLSRYLELAAVLSRRGGPDQAAQRMANISDAKGNLVSKDYLVSLAIGRWLVVSAKYDKAIEVLSRLAERPEVPEHVRGRAGMLLAESYAGAGHMDRALAQLDRLCGIVAFRNEALLGKARLLAKMRQPDRAEATLAELRELARKEGDKDAPLLRAIAEGYASTGQPDKALNVCDAAIAAMLNDSRNHLLRAVLLKKVTDRFPDAIASYRKAIELQPKNISLYEALAEAFAAEQRMVEALGVLQQLEGLGPAAATVSLYRRGTMFARWGLHEQAAEHFGALVTLGHGGSPAVQMGLGQAFAALGRRDQAVGHLESVPVYSDYHVPARLLLARLAPTPEGRLTVIRQLRLAKPGLPDVLRVEMAVLMEAGRAPEALQAYKTYTDKHIKTGVPPAGPAHLAVQIHFERGHKAAARDLAARLAAGTAQARWRNLAVMLTMDDDPHAALKLLPDPTKADPFGTLLGLCLAHRTNDQEAAKKWQDRFLEVTKPAEGADPSANAPYRLLVALAVGKTDEAKTALASVKGKGILGFGKAPTIEAASAADPTAARAKEALGLLRASVALEIGLPSMAHTWAMDLLKARPTCHWAAAIAARSQADPGQHEKIIKLLRPKDCAVAHVLQGELLMSKAQFADAAKAFGRAARLDGSAEHLLKQGLCEEYAGRLEEALNLYREVWQKSSNPTAANNAAYLTTRLYSKDPARLTEAKQLAEKAVQQVPRNASFRDTLAWILYLEGQHEQACMELRKAVVDRPQSPVVQYHLGMAESACGRPDLARWHLSAAVSIAESLRSAGKPVPAEIAQTASLCRQALAALGQPK